MEIENKMIGADVVSEVLGVSKTYAYSVIKQLNQELKDKGYLTVSGKVEGSYFLRRYFPSIDAAMPPER